MTKKKPTRKAAPKRLYAAVWWFQNQGEPVVASASPSRHVAESHAAVYGDHSEVITYTRTPARKRGKR